VIFNLFFEAEPCAAILIAHGSHGRSHEFVLWSTREAQMAEIRGRRPRAGKGFWEENSKPSPPVRRSGKALGERFGAEH